ncbi:MAG: sigma-54 dependent transcriptional regulator, partial [Pseudomonadota bacterium]
MLIRPTERIAFPITFSGRSLPLHGLGGRCRRDSRGAASSRCRKQPVPHESRETKPVVPTSRVSCDGSARPVISRCRWRSLAARHIARPLPIHEGELGIVGNCPGFRVVLERARRVAQYDLFVELTGETGTGKEFIARFIHDHSRRAGGPFVAVFCPAFSNDLLESELFGHRRGSFTGAFERASGGTLFLDEIGDMALEHQTKVLRAIQTGEVRRVGDTQVRKVDIRIVTATHRDLHAMVAAGQFREDLLHRLAGYEVSLPPLRDRGRDIIDLAREFLHQSFPSKRISPEAEAALLCHRWPGNIRELQNIIGAAAIDAGHTILPE